MQPTIELTGISKAFPGVVALADVSLALHPGRIHALVGENGAGKSTLINILGGSLPPDHGTIHLDGRPLHFPDAHTAHRLGIVTVHQEVDLFPDLSVAENIALEQGLPAQRFGLIDRRGQAYRARQALALVHDPVPPTASAGMLSPAQRQLVILGAALTRSARALILDEPTSSLSAAESDVLFHRLRLARKEGIAILYVSHRLEEIFALADEVTVLRDGRRVWYGSLAETSPGHLIEQMVGRELKATTRPSRHLSGPVLLRCQDLGAADGSCSGISLEARAGEVLGLYGLVGAGRSEWAQTVLGLRKAASGEVWLNGRRVTPAGPGPMARQGLAYVPEDRLRQGICRTLSIRANYVLASLRRLATGLWLRRDREAEQTRAAAEKLSVRMRSIEQAIGTLSGGNQQKVVLGRWLEREPTVLILDEPTRGIDVAAKGEIHALMRRLAGEGRAIVLISSDLPEVLSESDRVGVFRGGRLAAEFDPRRCTPAEIAAAAMPVATVSSPEDRRDKPGGSSAADEPPGLSRRSPGEPPDQRQASRPSLREAALLGLILLLFAALQARTGRFLQAGNLNNLATDTALLGFCALGSMLVLLVGGIDISLGSLMALSAGVAGWFWQENQPLPVVLAIAVGLGGLGGFCNAALTLVGKVHPIVITLGTLSLYRGLTQWWLEQDVQIPGSERAGLVALLVGVPVLVWVGLGLAVLLALGLARTVVGRYLYAVGSNPAAAWRAGISQTRVWLVAFTVQGMLAGLAGILYLARSGGMQAVSYEDKTLQAIGAAVVGGVAITGGRGSVLGVLLGCLLLVSLGPACQFLHVPTTWQRTLVGVVTVIAVLLDSRWRGRQS